MFSILFKAEIELYRLPVNADQVPNLTMRKGTKHVISCEHNQQFIAYKVEQ